MVENKTEHMLNIGQVCKSNFATATVSVATADAHGYKSAFTADVYCVENKTFSSRECRGEKYRFARTFRLVENRLNTWKMHSETKNSSVERMKK